MLLLSFVHNLLDISYNPIVAVEITQGPMEVTSLIGGEVTFTCMATGIPLPTITWMDQDGVINASNETILDMITVYSQIIIPDVQMEDFTTYTCTAMNLFGMIAEDAMLVNASMFLMCLMDSDVL